ncbi:MAG: tetratricopeptide repeat protein [Nitrospiraceae bacterium]|nr:tetratricopeptide repeat protein [Nitrospiraceae bacterium]
MPHTIKKRAPKEAKTDGAAVYSELKESIAKRQKTVLTLSIAVLAVLAIAAGIYFYHSNAVRTANNNNAQGYALYYGLSAQTPPAAAQRYTLALSFFQKAYAARKSAYSLYYIGASQYALGQYGQALDTFKKVYSNYPGDAQFVPLSLYKSAMAALMLGKNADALKYLSMMESSQFNSLKDMAYYEDARILASMGRKDEANRKIDELIRLFPESPYAQDLKAQMGAAQAPAAAAGKQPAQAGSKTLTPAGK